MKQVQKEYQKAFLLEPTKLGRIVDTIHHRLADNTNTSAHDTFEVFLSGNRREELTSLDDVLALDNSRRQRINRLLILCTASAPGAARPEHEVQVDFAAPKVSHDNSVNKVIAISVRSEAPGWASRTLSEVEEQIERTGLRRGQPLGVLMLLFVVGATLLLSQFVFVSDGARPEYMWLHQSDMARIQNLLAQHRTLTDEDAREILTMQLRNVARVGSWARPATASREQSPILLIVPLVVVLGCIMVLMITCYPSAVFFWGDEIERYNSALQRRKALWGVIISVTVVGVLSKLLFEWLSVWLARHS